jgi:hypothetical protein
MKKIKQFWNWYIKGEYHCDKCPLCWGGDYLPGCEDYDDCGCYLKGGVLDELPDSCRLLPPIRFLLGYFPKRKAEYYEAHQHDGGETWTMNDQGKKEEFNRLLKRYFEEIFLTEYPDRLEDAPLYQATDRFRTAYEGFLKQFQPPVPRKSVWKRFIDRCKPYFCK